MNTLARIAEEILKHSRFALFTHVSPDGDALGSSLALRDILERAGREAVCYFMEEPPETYRFLLETSARCRVIKQNESLEAEGCAIALDCGDARRLGALRGAFLAFPSTISIDHHQNGASFAALNYADPNAAATGELVFDLAKLLGAPFSPLARKCLFTALSTDTGNFKYAATAKTHRIAADLLDLGLNAREITARLYDAVRLEKLIFFGEAAKRIQFFKDGKIAALFAPDEFFREFSLEPEEADELPSVVMGVEGVSVGILLKTDGSGEARYKASLRGRGDGNCDLAEICRRHGGGGHKNAAGFSFSEDIEETLRTLVGEIHV
jgi:phosphoesterase RecJ-like protein